MARSFGAATLDGLSYGAFFPQATTGFSVAARVLVNSANSTGRRLVHYNAVPIQQYQFFFDLESTGTNALRVGFSSAAGTLFPQVTWVSGWGAGSFHAPVGTYDGATLRLYADGDPAPKATTATTLVPDTVPTGNFLIGNIDVGSTAQSWDGTIYEVGWWWNYVLSGPDAARFGIGWGADQLSRPPTAYWNFRLANIAEVNGLGRPRVSGSPGIAPDLEFVYDARRRNLPRSRYRAALAPVGGSDNPELFAGRMAWSQP